VVSVVKADDGKAERIDDNVWERKWEAQVGFKDRYRLGGESDKGTVKLEFREAAGELSVRIPYLVRHDRGLICYPDAIHFGVVPRSAESQRSITVVARDGVPFEIISAKCKKRAFDVNCEMHKPSIRAVVRIAFRSEKAGVYSAVLEVETSHPDQKKVCISLISDCEADSKRVREKEAELCSSRRYPAVMQSRAGPACSVISIQSWPP
jgi:hypothetical protein